MKVKNIYAQKLPVFWTLTESQHTLINEQANCPHEQQEWGWAPLWGRPLKVKNDIKASFYDRQGILFRLKLRQKWHFSTFIYFFYITFTYFRARVSQIIICWLSEIYEKKLKLFGKKTETFREETETFREETETFREETETFREETPFSTKKRQKH